MGKSASYLTHVQGLRGFAILLIVLFHMLPGSFPNGYIGVDMFLVISGYFLIKKQLDPEADFQFGSFIKSKILRILPPVLVTMLAAQLLGIALFPATEMQQAEKLVAALLQGIGNWFLNEESADYFAADTRLFPLMHLWYIGVLLQSYLLFGCLFFLWKKWHCSRRSRIISLLLIGGVSMALFTPFLLARQGGYYYSFYYCTAPRLWEFVFGGLLTLLPSKERPYLSWVPALCLPAAVVLACWAVPPLLASRIHFIGIRFYILFGAVSGALFICLGHSGICARFLNCRFLQAIGKISFSLYLVHWVWVCYAEYIICHSLSPLYALVLLFGIALSAVLLWRCAETPRFPLWSVALLWCLSAALHYSVYVTDGYRAYLHQKANACELTEERLPPYAPEHDIYRASEGIFPNQWRTDKTPQPLMLRIGNADTPPRFAVIGDSHAGDLACGLHYLSGQYHWQGVYLNSYVITFWGEDYDDRGDNNLKPGKFYNREKAEALMRWLQAHPEIRCVFLAQIWAERIGRHKIWTTGEIISGRIDVPNARLRELREMCRRIRAMGKEPVLVTDNPQIGCRAPFTLMRSRLVFGNTASMPDSMRCTEENYRAQNGFFLQIAQILESEGSCTVLRREKACFAKGDFAAYVGNRPLMRDHHHLTAEGAARTLYGLEAEIQRLLR